MSRRIVPLCVLGAALGGGPAPAQPPAEPAAPAVLEADYQEVAQARAQMEQARRQLEEAARVIATQARVFPAPPAAPQDPSGNGPRIGEVPGVSSEYMLQDRFVDLRSNFENLRLLGFRGSPWREMELVDVSPALGRYFGTTEGLLVVSAPDDDAIDLEDGDVILGIGGRTPNSPEHAVRILSSFEAGETVSFAIMRDRQQQTIDYAIPTPGDRAFGPGRAAPDPD